MSPSTETSWVSVVLAGAAVALVTLINFLVQRFNPDAKANAENALWQKMQKQLSDYDEREGKLESRIEALEKARDDDRRTHESQRLEYEKRISHLEEQIKDRDKQIAAQNAQIAELKRQVQAQGRQSKRGRPGGLAG